jgi:hypothetical protein
LIKTLSAKTIKEHCEILDLTEEDFHLIRLIENQTFLTLRSRQAKHLHELKQNELRGMQNARFKNKR